MTYTTTVEDISQTKKKYTITVSKEQVSKQVSIGLKNRQQKASIKGFRKGKAPLTIVKKAFMGEILEEVVNSLVDKAYQSEILNKGVQVVSQPSIEAKQQFDENEAFSFDATVEVNCPYDVKGYKEVVLKDEAPDFTEQDVIKQVKSLLRNKAKKTPVDSTDTTAQKNHCVRISYQGKVDGEINSHVTSHDQYLFLEDENIRHEMLEAIVGMKQGDSCQFQMTFENNFNIKELQGKTAEMHLNLNEIFNYSYPEDEKNLEGKGSFSQLEEEYTRAIRHEMQSHYEKLKLDSYSEQIIKQLSPINSDLPIADSLIEATIDRYIQLENNQLPTKEQKNSSDAEVRKQYQEDARKEVQGILILGNIARMEGLGVPNNDRDLNMELLNIARNANMPIKTMLDKYGSGIIEEARGMVLMRRTIKHIVGLVGTHKKEEKDEQYGTQPENH